MKRTIRILLSAHRYHFPAVGKGSPLSLLIVLPRVVVLSIDISLISAQGIRYVRQCFAPVVNTTVTSFGNAIFKFQLKVARTSSLPDDERVVLQWLLRSDLPDQTFIFHTPVGCISVPSRQGRTIKNDREIFVTVDNASAAVTVLRSGYAASYYAYCDAKKQYSAYHPHHGSRLLI